MSSDLYVQSSLKNEDKGTFILAGVIADIETSGYTVFSDRMVSGKTYPLHIRLNEIEYRVSSENGFESNKSYIRFALNSISESYYRHVISVWESNDGINGILGDVGLADPVWECSNVSTGAGVISAITPASIKGIIIEHNACVMKTAFISIQIALEKIVVRNIKRIRKPDAKTYICPI